MHEVVSSDLRTLKDFSKNSSASFPNLPLPEICPFSIDCEMKLWSISEMSARLNGIACIGLVYLATKPIDFVDTYAYGPISSISPNIGQSE